MIKVALREIRHRPRRLIATWAGIALSVAFLVATQILAHTELSAMGRSGITEALHSDIMVTVPRGTAPGTPADPSKAPAAIASVSGAVFAPLRSSSTSVGQGSTAQYADVSGVPDDESLRFGRIVSGRWPQSATEFVASQHDANALHLVVGGTTRFDGADRTLVGITDDPHTLLNETVRVRVPLASLMTASSGPDHQWFVKVPAGMSVAVAVDTINAELGRLGAGAVRAMPTSEYADEVVAHLAAPVNPLELIANAFGILSLVVGAIMISTTFAILLAQRRRQIALMRMIGASAAQMRASLLTEAVIVGAIGSLLGVGLGFAGAAGVSAWSGSLGFGLVIPWAAIVVSFLAGILATVLAAWVPVRRTMRVAPMEALREQATAQTHPFSIGRLVLCGLLVLAGVGLAVVTFSAGGHAFLVALASGALLSLGILAGSPLFVPPLLRGLGALARPFGPIPRLAADNASRNAARSAATATALMLAVGLVVTLQVATATTKAAMIDQIAAANPLDVSISSGGKAIPASTVAKLQAVPGLESSVVLQGGSTSLQGSDGSRMPLTVLRHDSGVDAVLSVPPAVGSGRAVVGQGILGAGAKSGDLTLTGAHGAKVTVHAKVVEYLADEVMVDPATFSTLVDTPVVTAVWLKTADKSAAASTYSAVTDIVGTASGLTVGGSLAYAAMITQILDALLLIATILSAVAVAISLIGVGNTLGLSVLERTRESALLRALGLQKRGLRASLTVEALLISVLGVAVGVLAGAWFGWFASAALMVTSSFTLPTLAVDPATTGVLVLIALAAAVGSSVLPGYRAAQATPVEALADVD